LAQLLSALPQAKILITHDMPFARATCSRAAFFSRGVIAEEGSVEQMAKRYEWDFVAPCTT
jgi:ABC-type polysaccharide/polyol phosphate transport system ATPase subunit